MNAEARLRHEYLLCVIHRVEIKIVAHQLGDHKADGAMLGEALARLVVLPVESAPGALSRIISSLHIVLVVDNFEHAAADLRAELAEDAICFHRLDHKVLKVVHFSI